MAGPLTATAMADPVLTVKSSSPTFFHSAEPWESIPLPLQLSSQNLSNLSAVLATLSIKNGDTQAIPQSASDSSSDSDSNHRLHRSSKKVCLREDLNTVREISPRRLKKPGPIEVADMSASQAKWKKPDTPAPWHSLQAADDNGGPFVDVSLDSPSDKGSQVKTPTQRRSSQVSPLSTVKPMKISIKRKRNNMAIITSLNANTRHTSLLLIRRPRIQPVSRRKGSTGTIVIRRASQLATPRPRSLPMSPRTVPSTLPTQSQLGHNSSQASDTVRPRSGTTSLQPGPSILVRSFAYDEIRNRTDSPALGTPSSWPPVENSSLLRTEPTEQVRPLRTYVDHVRNQRGGHATREVALSEAGKDVADMTAHRRRSSF